MAEGVVDLLEVVEVDEEERQLARVAQGVGLFGEEEIENERELSAIAEAGQLVGVRLAISFLGQDAQTARRDGEAYAHGEQCRDGEPQRDSADGVHGTGDEDEEPGRGGDTG